MKTLTLLLSILLLSFNSKTQDKALKDTVIRSVTYKLYEGSRGGRYILKTSKNGVLYKVYIKK